MSKKQLEIKMVIHSIAPEECRVLGGKPVLVGNSDVCIFVDKVGENKLDVRVETIGDAGPARPKPKPEPKRPEPSEDTESED